MANTEGYEAVHGNDADKQYNYLGLTKREYFVAMAMQGILANQDADTLRLLPEMITQLAIENADALIEGLNK